MCVCECVYMCVCICVYVCVCVYMCLCAGDHDISIELQAENFFTSLDMSSRPIDTSSVPSDVYKTLLGTQTPSQDTTGALRHTQSH